MRDALPYAHRIVLENLVRNGEDTASLAAGAGEIVVHPTRVLMQDAAGLPALADLAEMRSAAAEAGRDGARIDPVVPVDLIIDHSVIVDVSGTADAFERNLRADYARNHERFAFFKWCVAALRGVRVVPPGAGICHQINLEVLASVIDVRVAPDGSQAAFPELVVGTDSHTPMVGALGILAWGVGGIEAEAAMLGQPLSLPLPQIVAVRLNGTLRPTVTAADLVLTLTARLQGERLVGCIVEYVGKGAADLDVPDRATVANMAPEYGATSAYFPIDARTVSYLRDTGRPPERVALVERYARRHGLWHEPGDEARIRYARVIDVALDEVGPAMAGPARPEQVRSLDQVAASFVAAHPPAAGAGAVRDGHIAIAAITSCTNTSNPTAMIAAGLVARKAVARGLTVPAHVKTSLAPGSTVVMDYLARAGLRAPLAALGFALVAYGCATCVGNSGPLLPGVAEAARDERKAKLVAVLSGNRNFEGRIHPDVGASYLAAPALVVAYALAGTILRDFSREPVGTDAGGVPVMLDELMPSPAELAAAREAAALPAAFAAGSATAFAGDAAWRRIESSSAREFAWNATSTYLKRPPFLRLGRSASAAGDVTGARLLAVLGDAVTTDHISPVGTIAADSAAADYLRASGVADADFNTYGARRGNHDVMVRGTFAHPRLDNALAGVRGPFTLDATTGRVATIFAAAQSYLRAGVPCVVVAGDRYGSGSARDWAAKGTRLLGVAAVVARGFERIHRDNLVRMGVLPLEFVDAPPQRLDALDTIDLLGLGAALRPGGEATLLVRARNGGRAAYRTRVRIDTAQELEYFLGGGILPTVFGRIG